MGIFDRFRKGKPKVASSDEDDFIELDLEAGQSNNAPFDGGGGSDQAATAESTAFDDFADDASNIVQSTESKPSIWKRFIGNQKHEGTKAPKIIANEQLVGLFTHVETSKWWALDSNRKLLAEKKVDSLKPGRYLSFGRKEDWSMPLDRSMRVVEGDILADVGEPIFKIKMGGKDKQLSQPWAKKVAGPWLYASQQERINDAFDMGVKLIPGPAIIRSLLVKSEILQTMEAPFITGLFFPGEDMQALVLMVCNEDGDFEHLDFIPLSGIDATSAITSYVQSTRLDASGQWDERRLAVFESSEIDDVLDSVHPYPNERDIFGITESKIWKMGAVTGVCSIVAIGAASGALHLAVEAQKNKLQKLNAQISTAQTEARNALIQTRLEAYAAMKTVDVSRSIDVAKQVWQPGAAVSIVSSSADIKVTAQYLPEPMDRDDALIKALAVQAPEGCTTGAPNTSTGLQELQITYECQTHHPDLDRLSRLAR